MPGSIGIDVQDSRTAIALLESAGGSVAAASVGDGRRPLVPHACTATAWGSAAAEAILAESGAAGPAAAPPAGEDLARLLTAWRRSPWDEEFLRGIRGRLDSYTGRTPLTSGSYRLAVCADPELADWPRTAGRLASAGLPDPELADPADALVCRWVSEAAAAPPDGSVILAVACGETYTLMRGYTITGHGPGLEFQAMDSSRAGAGTSALTAALAGDVLARCRPGVPPAALLALLDGTAEFAAALRARPGAAAEWSGALSEYLFAPLRVTAAELARRPEAAELADFCRTAPARLVRHGRPAIILAGGPGAVWPVPGGELAALGPVWQSREPELDLAVGACWWPLLRRVFSGRQAAGWPAAELAAAEPAALAAAPAAAENGQQPKPDPLEVPPWER